MRILTFSVFLLLLVTVGVLSNRLVGQRGQTRNLQSEVRELESEKKHLLEEVSRREAAVREAEQMVTKGVLELKRLEADLVKARVPVKEPVRAGAEVPRTKAVMAYLGEESLGRVWAVPRNIAKDPETGEFTFETVVVLDEKFRRKFTVTNVVEQEVIRTATVNDNYVPPQRNYYPYYNPYVTYGVRPPEEEQPGRGADPVPTLPSPPRSGGSPWGPVWVPPVRK